MARSIGPVSRLSDLNGRIIPVTQLRRLASENREHPGVSKANLRCPERGEFP
jgi:hypothetical protein